MNPIIKGIRSAQIMGLFVVSLGMAASLHAVNFTETWESYSEGASPASPWLLQGGGGSTPLASSITIQSQTFSGNTSNWALINNAATNESSTNPTLRYSFSSTAEPLAVSFSYVVPTAYSALSQWVFLLRASNSTIAVQMGLGFNSSNSSGGMYYTNSSNSKVSIGHTFSQGEVIDISLTNINVSTSTFDIAWSSSTGAQQSISGATFRNTVSNLSGIFFVDNTSVSTTSKLFLDNIAVTDVAPIPEPSAITLIMAMICAMFAFITKRNRW